MQMVENRMDKMPVSVKSYDNIKQWNYNILKLNMVYIVKNCWNRLGCKTLDIGKKQNGPKELSFDEEYKCPTVVDKTVWLNQEEYSDTFSVEQRGMKVIVTRTDSGDGTLGWGMSLKIECCKDGKYLS